MSKQEQYKIIHIAAMVIVSILAVVIFYIPRINKSGAYREEITNLKKVVAKLDQISSNPAGFESSKNQVVDKLYAVQEKVTLQPMIPQVLEQISKPLQEFGITLISITPLAPVQKTGSAPAPEAGQHQEAGGGALPPETSGGSEGYIETPIELNVHATYKQIGMYFDKLRHMQRLVRIDDFSFKSSKDISPKLDIKLKLSVFHYGKE